MSFVVNKFSTTIKLILNALSFLLMKNLLIIMFLMLVVITSLAFGLAESKLEYNVTTNVNYSDLIDENGNLKMSSVVVGYDSAVTDYLVGANLAIYLTSISGSTFPSQLFCSNLPMSFFLPLKQEISLRTDLNTQTPARILIGGPAVNGQVSTYPEVAELLKEPGNIIVKKYGDDIIIAGYSAFDTERGAEYFTNLLENYQR